MVRFISNRLLYGLIVLILVTVIVSTIVNLSPVDPARLTFGQRLDEETVALKREQLGLDLPLTMQITKYLGDVSPLHIVKSEQVRDEYAGIFNKSGNYIFGLKWPYLRESYQSGRSVSQILKSALPNTIILAFTAIGLAIFLGLVMGIVAALYKDTWIDRSLLFLSTLGYSVPSYVTAIVLGVTFGYYLRGFTGLNIQGSFYELNDMGDNVLVFKNMILPSIALGIRPVSIVTQLMRSSMLNIVDEKYVIAARAKGLSNHMLVKNHMIKNALNPVVTALSGWFAALLAGAFFVEYIFNFKGLGFVTVTALLNYDIPVVIGALLLTSAIFILINIAVDLLYSLLDPRIEFK